MVDLKEEHNEDTPQFYLAYWRSHVFPVQYAQLANIKTYMDKYITRFASPNTRFCVIPGIAKFVEAFIRKHKISGSLYHQLPASIREMDLRLMLPCI